MAVQPINSNRIARISFERSSLLKMGGIPTALITEMMVLLPVDAKLIGFLDANLVTEMHFESNKFKDLQEGDRIPEITPVFINKQDGSIKLVNLDMSQALDQSLIGLADTTAMKGTTVKVNTMSGTAFPSNSEAASDCDCGTNMDAHSLSCPKHPSRKPGF